MAIASIVAWVGSLAVTIISTLGYLGVFFLMILESMIVPLPSELVMPFAGYLASTGTFTMLGVIVASTLGSLVGSLLSYYIGAWGGLPLLKRYGKYVLVSAHDIEKTQQWFGKKGQWKIFVARFIPVVRHLISIPAGVARMPLGKFCISTILGAGIWNTFLAGLGFYLGKNWALVRHYSEPLSILVVILVIVGLIWFVYNHMRKK